MSRSAKLFTERVRGLTDVQALGQCRVFLAKNFPSASLHKTKSTAAAAETLSGSDSLSSAAAICSRLCASFFPELEILFQGIQDENGVLLKYQEEL